MNAPKEILDTLTDEQKKKIENAKTPEDLLAIARETGYELSREQLNDLSGGGVWDDCQCFDYGCHDFVNM